MNPVDFDMMLNESEIFSIFEFLNDFYKIYPLSSK